MVGKAISIRTKAKSGLPRTVNNAPNGPNADAGKAKARTHLLMGLALFNFVFPFAVSEEWDSGERKCAQLDR